MRLIHILVYCFRSPVALLYDIPLCRLLHLFIQWFIVHLGNFKLAVTVNCDAEHFRTHFYSKPLFLLTLLRVFGVHFCLERFCVCFVEMEDVSNSRLL